MATLTGQDTYVWYQAEGTGNYNAAPNSGTYAPFKEVTSISGRGKARERADLRVHGFRQRAGSPELRIDEDNLSIEVNLTDAIFDDFIAGFDETHDGTESWAIVVANNNTAASATNVEVYKGCVVDSVEVSIDTENVITATIEFIRAESAYGTTLTAVGVNSATFTSHATTSTYFVGSDVTLAKAGDFNQDNTIDTIAHDITISVSQNGEKKYRLNGTNAHKPIGVHLGQHDVTLSITVDYDDLNEFTDINYDGSITVTVSGLGSFTFNGVTYDSAYVDSAPNELLTIDLPMTADTVDIAVN